MSNPTQSQPLRWEPKWDTSASAIHRSHPKDGDPGQGAREIWEPQKANPFPLPREQEFFQSLQLSRRAGGSQQIPRWWDDSPAQTPHGHRGVRRAARPPSGCPADGGRFLCNSAIANHLTQQESGGFGLTPVQDFCLMAIFPPPSLFFQVQSFPRLHSSILRITETAGNSPQSKEGKTHNSPSTAACRAWIVQPEEQI